MRSIQTGQSFPLASVKPLDWLADYRKECLSATQEALKRSGKVRENSPVTGKKMKPVGEVEGLPYALCEETGSLFLAKITPPDAWEALLSQASQYRRAPGRQGGELSQSRTHHVYAPKLDWIRETLTLQGIRKPRILETATPPSELTSMLKESSSFAKIETVNEMELAHGRAPGGTVEAVVMLESLDRVDDPVGLLKAASGRIVEGGLLFVTSLVASGFDVRVLGLSNRYLYPPDRTNCFSIGALQMLLEKQGFKLLELSTPGVLDLEIVLAHLQADPHLKLSDFERQLVTADAETKTEFQNFLQRRGLSSFARMVAKKR